MGVGELRDKADRLAQRVDFVMPSLKHYGLGAWLTWSYASYHGANWVPSFVADGLSFLVFFVSTLTLAMMLAVLLLLDGRGKLPKSKLPMLVSALLATVGAMVLELPSGSGDVPNWLFVVAAALTGMGSAVLMLAAARMLESAGPREAFVIAAKNSALILVAYFVIDGVSDGLAFCIKTLSFMVAGLLLSLGERADEARPSVRHPLTRRVRYAFCIGIALLVLGFSLVDSLARSTEPNALIGQVDADVLLASMAFIGLILLAYIFLGRPVDLLSNFHAIVAIMLAVLALTLVFGTGSAALAIPFGTCRFLLQAPIFALCIQLAAWLGVPAFWVVGPLQIAMCVADVIGSAIPVFLPALAEHPLTRVVALLVIAFGLFVAFVLVLPRATMLSLLPGRTLGDHAGLDEAADGSAEARFGWKERCRLVGEESHLTEREMDVLVPLSHGLAPTRIAEDLGLSYYTVRAHTRNIYAKTGVHSRQELIDLIDGAGES